MNIKIYTTSKYNDTRKLYSDGVIGYILSCSLNNEECRKGIGMKYTDTSMTRLEIHSILQPILAIADKSAEVVIYTDSKFVSDKINDGDLSRWAAEDFQYRANNDLWRMLYEELSHRNVKVVWVADKKMCPMMDDCGSLVYQAEEGKFGCVEDKIL